MHKFRTAGVDGAGEQKTGVRALERGSGWLLQVAATAWQQAALHLYEVWQEHTRRELVPDERLEKRDIYYYTNEGQLELHKWPPPQFFFHLVSHNRKTIFLDNVKFRYDIFYSETLFH